MGGALGEALVKRIAFCASADEINPAGKGRDRKEVRDGRKGGFW